VRLLCVIPARLGSQRLVHKPLRLIAGEPLIRLVARRVLEFGLDGRIVVATDDRRVVEAVAGLDVEPLLTRAGLASGTDRVGHALEHPAYRAHDVVVNVQGDEPLIERAAVIGALERVTRDHDDIGTSAAPLEQGDLTNPNRVKVAVDGRSRALAFFRTPRAPACGRRDATFRHVGVYAYRTAALRRWMALPPNADEANERLEQLRPLAHGMQIGVAVQEDVAAPGVDTEADIREVERRLAAFPTANVSPGDREQPLAPGASPGLTGGRG
jgi:3-deoxy-manno-octulosonate cytidylyltransferase (CMP-KDO synthetase)